MRNEPRATRPRVWLEQRVGSGVCIGSLGRATLNARQQGASEDFIRKVAQSETWVVRKTFQWLEG
jgi:hypothetical protein